MTKSLKRSNSPSGLSSKSPENLITHQFPTKTGILWNWERMILPMRRYAPSVFLALLSLSVNAQDRTLSRPDIHGNQIVFTAEGDLWLGDITTGQARRITVHPGNETTPHFSPDGSSIAFTGQYDGTNDAYVMPVEGGVPKRITYGPAVQARRYSLPANFRIRTRVYWRTACT